MSRAIGFVFDFQKDTKTMSLHYLRWTTPDCFCRSKVIPSNLLFLRNLSKESWSLSFWFYSRACILWRLMCFSRSRRSWTSAPYLPTVPSSTRRKWECRLLRTFSLLRGFSSVWYGAIICSKNRKRRKKNDFCTFIKQSKLTHKHINYGCDVKSCVLRLYRWDRSCFQWLPRVRSR